MKCAENSLCEADPLLSFSLKFQKQKRKPTVEHGALFALFSAALIQPICFDIIFPFINQMVLENNIVDSSEKVGFHSGSVESLFAVVALLSVIPWTVASDYFGRKPVVLCGGAGMAVSMALFGMSKKYWMMIVTRCICGMFGGTQTIVKVSIAEVFPDEFQRISTFSALQISIRIGRIVGQSMGGWFSHPEHNFVLFDTYFWRKYPFSLPCFMACVLGLSSWMYGVVALRETLPPRKEDERSSTSSYNSRTTCDLSSENLRSGPLPLSSSLTPRVKKKFIGPFMMTFVSETLHALYPLYAFTPRESGGLGFSGAQTLIHMTARVIIFVFISVISSPLQQSIGSVRTYQLGVATWPLSVVFFPVLNLMARSETYGDNSPLFWLVFFVFELCWGSGSLVWPYIQVTAVNISPGSTVLATGSSVSQVLQFSGEALAPAFTTYLFAYSLEHDIVDGNLTYIVLLGIGSLWFIHALTLKESVYHTDKNDHSPNIEC